ncbi:MAG TPA: helix-turn-helix domain-containing protein [Anaerolineales bacterium]|nr:helix-turn-helix domain-containing protein [Anaerolineales bacterium]
MRTLAQSDLKGDYLRKYASLNPHPEHVRDALFQTHPFFDPCDLVQIKYEMLRQVIIDGHSVEAATAAFGFSRVRWYQLQKCLAAEGLVGLLPHSKGPRRASKLSNEVVTSILQTLQAEPELRMAELPMRVAQQFGLSVHVRSIERVVARGQKKACPKLACRTDPLRQQSGPGSIAGSDMKPCAVRRSKASFIRRPETVPAMRVSSWRSSNSRDWPLG